MDTATKPAYGTCACMRHGGPGNRCCARNVIDPTRPAYWGGGVAICEYCRLNCGHGPGDRVPTLLESIQTIHRQGRKPYLLAPGGSVHRVTTLTHDMQELVLQSVAPNDHGSTIIVPLDFVDGWLLLE